MRKYFPYLDIDVDIDVGDIDVVSNVVDVDFVELVFLIIGVSISKILF